MLRLDPAAYGRQKILEPLGLQSFDKEASYSTGCITIDPNDPSRIWMGSGENVGGRHVGYGDGVYLSQIVVLPGKNMGLKSSEHISKIIVHPDNSDVVLGC